MTRTMRAIALSEPGGVDKLVVKDVPLPQSRPGWVRIRVKAFGINESEVARNFLAAVHLAALVAYWLN